MSDGNDEFDDFFKMVKKYLGINADIFDVDFLFLPEPILDKEINPNTKKEKGFKVRYHFESGMDKPEVSIEGDFDQNKLQEYFKTLNLSKYPNFRQFTKKNKKKEFNAKELRIESIKDYGNINSIEPYSDINEYEDFIEIIMEVPGVEGGHFLLSLSEDGRNLKISAESQRRKFLKTIELPIKCTMEKYNLKINNGIATLKLYKLKSK